MRLADLRQLLQRLTNDRPEAGDYRVMVQLRDSGRWQPIRDVSLVVMYESNKEPHFSIRLD